MSDSVSYLCQLYEHQSPVSVPSSFQAKKKKIKKSQDFSLEDDMVLIELVRTYGPKFHKFLKYFKKKNLNQLKNRYYKKLRYIQLDQDLCQNEKNQRSDDQLEVKELTKTIKQLEFSGDISSLLHNFVIGLANITSHF